VDKTWRISKDYVFSVSVTSAIFDATRCGWTVLLSNGSQITAQWLIPAVGHASQPNLPEVAGFERFQGQTFHTANWPAYPITWADKRVSIIGTGASAVQIIQELAPQVQHLTVFQRSPMVGFSKTRNDSTAGNKAEVTEYTNTNLARRMIATSTIYHSGFPYEFRKEKMSSLSDEDIEKHFAKTLSQGNWCYLLSGFEESVYDPESNAKMYSFWATQTRRRILDERLRDLLVPLSPKAPIGMKRPCLEANYYETFNRGNVELVDISAEEQMELTETGILYSNTHHDSDYIIWATGFESRAVNLTNMDIRGSRGISLKKTWLNKVSTNLGMTVAGFPNMFMVYGPQSATVRVNGPSVIDAQIAWMCSTLERLRSAGVTWFEPTEASERAWLEKMEVSWNSSLYSQTETWETRGMTGNTGEPAW
jgi:cation diffusion facilitator CzcD-associated flavoprotein CzcO